MSIDAATWRQAWLDLDQTLQWSEQILLFSLLLVILILGLFELIQGFSANPGRSTDGSIFRAALLWIVMLSAVLATSEGHGWKPSRSLQRRPETTLGTARIPALLLSAGGCLALAWASLRYLIVDLRLGSAGPLGSPGWVQLLILPYGFSLMSVRLLARALGPKRPAEA